MAARELVIEAADRAAIAVDRYRKGGPGFDDQMIALAGQGAGCQATITFDRKAADLPGTSRCPSVSTLMATMTATQGTPLSRPWSARQWPPDRPDFRSGMPSPQSPPDHPVLAPR